MHLRNKIVILALLCVILSQLPLSSTQHCEVYLHNSHPATQNICDEFIGNGTLVFVNENETQASQDISIATFSRLAFFFPLNCSKVFLNLFCRTGFAACDTTPSLFPSLACKSQCFEAKQLCEPYLQGAQIDCDQKDVRTGYELWPEKESSFVIFGQTFVIPCSNKTEPAFVSGASTTCPYPFQHTQLYVNGVQRGDTRSICEPGCPFPLLLDDDFVIRQKILDVTNPISIFLLLLVITIYAMMPSRRRFPHRYKMNVLLSGLGLSLSFFVSVAARIPNVSCSDSTTVAPQTHAICAVQGATIIYFGISAALWYTVTNVNVWGLVYFPLKKRLFEQVEKTVHIVGWLLPLVFVIIGLANQKVGSYTNSTFCTLTQDDDWVWHYGLLYGPLVFLLLSSIVSLAATTFIIAKHDISTFKRHRANTIYAPKISYNKYRHLVIFCALGVYLYIIVISERFNWTRIIGGATEKATDWMACRVDKFSKMEDEDICPRPTFGSDMHFEMFFHFTCGTLGLCIALLCAIESEFLLFVKVNFLRIFCGVVPTTNNNPRRSTYNSDNAKQLGNKSTAVMLDERPRAASHADEDEESLSMSANADVREHEGKGSVIIDAPASNDINVEQLKKSLD